jgi:hypothetical protein
MDKRRAFGKTAALYIPASVGSLAHNEQAVIRIRSPVILAETSGSLRDELERTAFRWKIMRNAV